MESIIIMSLKTSQVSWVSVLPVLYFIIKSLFPNSWWQEISLSDTSLQRWSQWKKYSVWFRLRCSWTRPHRKHNAPSTRPTTVNSTWPAPFSHGWDHADFVPGWGRLKPAQSLTFLFSCAPPPCNVWRSLELPSSCLWVDGDTSSICGTKAEWAVFTRRQLPTSS